MSLITRLLRFFLSPFSFLWKPFLACVHTEQLIQCPPAKVWRCLTDYQAYPQWSRFITFPQPPADVGQPFTIQLTPAGGHPYTFHPVLTFHRENVELRWCGKLLGSSLLFVGEHYFRIDPKGKGSTRFLHGERFYGILIPFLGCIGMWKFTHREFTDFNEQLKARMLGWS
eukprot:jgi/Chrzof1/9232/Cz03g40240.t1